jgi:hypothetical protein
MVVVLSTVDVTACDAGLRSFELSESCIGKRFPMHSRCAKLEEKKSRLKMGDDRFSFDARNLRVDIASAI